LDENTNQKVSEILDCLKNAGCIVDLTKLAETSIFDLIENSIMFVTFIVELEEHFEIEFPDEYLVPEKFSTLETVISSIEELSCGDCDNKI